MKNNCFRCGNLRILLLLCLIGSMQTTAMADIVRGRVVDAETGYEQYVDTGSRSLRESYRRYWMKRQSDLKETFAKSNVDNVSIATDGDYVKSLMGLFKQRG